MATLAPVPEQSRPSDMATVTRLDPDTAWAAFMRRDRSWDGRVIGAVKTTGMIIIIRACAGSTVVGVIFCCQNIDTPMSRGVT